MGRHTTGRQDTQRGRVHHSDDGRWWWDEARRGRLPLADEQDVLEIELQDVGGTSVWASLAATLGSQYGNACYHFVGRVHSGNARGSTDVVVGGRFPSPRGVGSLAPQEEWAPDMPARLGELRAELEAQGWRPAGRGPHPWSFRYRRPRLDGTRPAETAAPAPAPAALAGGPR